MTLGLVALHTTTADRLHEGDRILIDGEVETVEHVYWRTHRGDRTPSVTTDQRVHHFKAADVVELAPVADDALSLLHDLYLETARDLEETPGAFAYWRPLGRSVCRERDHGYIVGLAHALALLSGQSIDHVLADAVDIGA